MKYYNILINLFITILLLSFVKADDEETTEKPEVILESGPIIGDYKKKDLNDSYDEKDSVKISCTGSTCTSDNDSVTINKGNVTISTEGTYVFEGKLKGQIYISAKKKDFIHLVLNNIDITSDLGPAIHEVKCDKLVITTIGENSLTDSTNYPVGEEEKEDEDEEDTKTDEDDTKKKTPNACLFTKSDLTLNGKGTLSITGNYYVGIGCQKNLKFVSGTINVTSANKGIKAKNSISFKEATVNVDAVDSGIKVTKDTDSDKGFIVIDGGKVTVKSGNDGIHAETHLTINDGYVDVIDSKEGIEGQMIDIVNGEVHVTATDDGINASKIGAPKDPFQMPPIGPDGLPDFSQLPDFSAFAGANASAQPPNDIPTDNEKGNANKDAAKKPDNKVVDANAKKNITKKKKRVCVVKKGLKKLSKAETEIETKPKQEKTVTTDPFFSDDNPFNPFGPGYNRTANDDKVYIRITGGKIYVTVNGFDVDGIDSNGSLYIGGESEVYVSNSSGDIYGFMAALDAEGSNVIDAGVTVIATANSSGNGFGGFPGLQPPGSNMTDIPGGMGPGGMGPGGMGPGGMGPGGNMNDFPPPPPGMDEEGEVKQGRIQVTIESQEVGTELIVKDKDGKVIISHKPTAAFSKILISTPKLKVGETYTVIAGTETQEATAVDDSI